MKSPKTIYVCQTCGAQAQKWLGRCPDCNAWNSMVEEQVRPVATAADTRGLAGTAAPSATARLFADVDLAQTERLPTGFAEFDRVLGGGLVPGSMVLLGGEPGIGKSTLLLQAAARVAQTLGTVLYASGEESEHQVKSRGERLGVGDAPLYLLAETCLERILDEVDRLDPALLIVDSIQTVFSLQLAAAPGSIGQVREAATRLLFTAKRRNLPTFLVGHVTKDGALAGPKALEHIVDTVLYFEGERHHSHRVVRAVKNRFGAVSELGLFEMTGTGLEAVPNPSRLFLSERAVNVPGLGGAVLSGGLAAAPARGAGSGEQRGLWVGATDGERSGSEPPVAAAGRSGEAGGSLGGGRRHLRQRCRGAERSPSRRPTWAIVAAVVSSFRNRPVRRDTVTFGEVGLAGEVRGTPQAGLRVKEAAQLGFGRCVMPATNRSGSLPSGELELVGVRTLEEALEALVRVMLPIPLVADGVLADSLPSASTRSCSARSPLPPPCRRPPWDGWRIGVRGPGLGSSWPRRGCEVRVSGLDTGLSPMEAYLFVSNHQSIYDTPILWATLPFQLRIIAKASLGRFPVLGWHLRYTGHLLVDRARPGKVTLNRVAELMGRGHSMSVYAEGTRSLRRPRGSLQGRAVSHGRRVRSPGRAGGDRREPARHEEGASDDVPRGRGSGGTPPDADGGALALGRTRAGHPVSGRDRTHGRHAVARCRSAQWWSGLGPSSPGGGGGPMTTMTELSVESELARVVALGVLWLDHVRVGADAPDPPPAPASPAVLARTGLVRAMYRRMGIDPTRTRPSSEALLRRLRRGQPWPVINNLVDAINVCSVTTQLPFGLYDLDRIQGDVTLRVGHPGEEYAGIGKPVVHLEGRPVLCDAQGPFGNPTSDSARTMVTPETTRAWVVVYAPPELDSADLTRVLDDAARRASEATEGIEVRRRIVRPGPAAVPGRESS